MNFLIRVGVVLFACLLAVALRAAESRVKVEGSRELRVAVVDSNRDAATREAMHQAFASSLGVAISQACGSRIGVKIKDANADHAAFNLGTGVYDAVLVLGATLPRPLILSECARLSVTLGSGKNERKAFLIFGTGDTALAKLFGDAFVPAISDAKFLDAMDGRGGERTAGGGGGKAAGAR